MMFFILFLLADYDCPVETKMFSTEKIFLTNVIILYKAISTSTMKAT